MDLVIWTGYAERGDNDPNYDWVTPFESKTGCKVKTQDGTDSANMVQLMQSGQYDGVSASGDATKRLIAAGLVSPINPALIPNYANIFDSLKLKDYNSVNGVPYGVPHGRGANLLLYNTDTFTTAPTSWDVVFKADSPAAGKISIYNSAIYIADAAMYLKAHNADLKITNPYELDQAQFDAAVKLLKDQKKIVGQYWSTAEEQMQSFTSKDSLAGTSWPYQANLLTDQPIGQTIPSEGATGWSDTWMISSPRSTRTACTGGWTGWPARTRTPRRPSGSARPRPARLPARRQRRSIRATATRSMPRMRRTTARSTTGPPPSRNAATTAARSARTSATGRPHGRTSPAPDGPMRPIQHLGAPGPTIGSGAPTRCVP